MKKEGDSKGKKEPGESELEDKVGMEGKQQEGGKQGKVRVLKIALCKVSDNHQP